MTREEIYEFIARQKTLLISSVGEDRRGVTDPDYCILKFTGHEAQWFAGQRTQTITL